jgi:hypothetical protein
MSTQAAAAGYAELHRALESSFGLHRPRTDLEAHTGVPVELFTYEFTSPHWRIHPAEHNANTDPAFRALVAKYIDTCPYSQRNFFHALQPADRDIPENLRFRYAVFSPKGHGDRIAGATVLLHGLNEKSWRKYLAWAVRLVERTGRPVILFPLAFHMNRAPSEWSNGREMMGVSRERRKLFPGIEASSFVNAALSHRVQFAPHRFLTSGLQSYYDVTDLARSIRAGAHDLFAEGARVDFFGYSIGASLVELLLLADPAGLFAESRAFLFCGGSVMDRTHPVSKSIIDGRAYRGLSEFFERLVSDTAQAIPRGVEILKAGLWEVEVIKSLLFADRLRSFREKLARAVGERVAALAMARDRVFPPNGLHASWTSSRGPSPFSIDTADPEFDYSHERPFPLEVTAAREVDRFFTEVTSRAAEHLGR